MPKSPKKLPLAYARGLAAAAVDRYFAEVVNEIPSDGHDEDLIVAAFEIKAAIMDAPDYAVEDDGEHAALTAGYLIGVEIGRRLGGAR